MKQLTTIILGAWCACMMTANAVTEEFTERFGVPKPGAPEYLGSTLTVTNDTVTTAADGLATFRVTYDITANAGGSLIGTLGDSSQWGVSTGAVDDVMNPGDSATIDNIQIIDFNANGGLTTAGDITGLSFELVQITGGFEATDSGRIIANGITNVWVDVNAEPADFVGHLPGTSRINLPIMTSSDIVSSFTVEGVAEEHRIFDVWVSGDTELANSKLKLDKSSLTMTLQEPATTVEKTIDASIVLGTASNDVEVISLVADSGFSAVISDSTITSNETITVTYTNSGDLAVDGDVANSTLVVTWTADGYGVTNTTDVALDVTFVPEFVLAQTVVDIFALATNDYGVDAVATLLSEVQTASDGLATYQISIDVDPQSGGSIVSGNEGGSTTLQSWGIDDAQFRGNLTNYVDSVDNIQIVNFSANGGSLTLGDFQDLSFASVTIADGQSTGDRVRAVANGITNNVGGVSLSTNPDVLVFNEFAGNDLVSEFSLANGSTNTTDKWSVNSVQVQFIAPNSKLTLESDALSLVLTDPATSVDDTLLATIGLGFETNDVEVTSLTADAGFSAVISGSTLSVGNEEETITVTYTNAGALLYNGDTADSTLVVTWTAVGTGVTNTTDVALDVTFSAVEPDQTIVDVFAVANTNYGTDAIATMYSATQTVGLATFQIAIDVDPKAGTAIDSGTSGGVSSNNSWGVGADNLFKGSDDEYVDLIDNVRVVNFNANGGAVTINDIGYLSFTSVTIVNGQTGNKDAVQVVVNGSVTNDLGDLSVTPEAVDLKVAGGVGFVTDFAVGVGVSPNPTLNKWSVYSIQVGYAQPDQDAFGTWVAGYGLAGADALPSADTIDMDGYDNLAEFALGMNPTNSDAGSKESVGTAVDGGTNYFVYVYDRRSDYVLDGLTYRLIDTADLVLGTSAATNAQDDVFVGAAVSTAAGDYEPVTNRYLTDDPVKFVELEIKQN
ncbi:beta strand repeat-containing protein [Pontiella sulfatireligans]|nr:hypothetical protein [Pontiella sulfatireligans]